MTSDVLDDRRRRCALGRRRRPGERVGATRYHLVEHARRRDAIDGASHGSCVLRMLRFRNIRERRG